MRLRGCLEPPRSGALPGLATAPEAWTCSAVQSHSNSLPLFFYLPPQGATTERSDYPPIKSWQFAAINRDCDSQAARQFLRAGLPRLICSKSCKRHPGRQTGPDGWMYILGSRAWAEHTCQWGREGRPRPLQGACWFNGRFTYNWPFHSPERLKVFVKEAEPPGWKEKVSKYKRVPPK